MGPDSAIERSIVGEGCEIYGKVYNSVIGPGVKIGKNTVVSHSIIMNETEIGENCNIEKAIIAEKAKIGSGVTLGAFEEKENETKPSIYCEGLCTIGEKSVIPDGVQIGKDTVVSHSIIMNETEIGDGCHLEKAIVAEKAKIGNRVTLGAFEETENETKPGIYCEGLCTIGEKSVIPDDVQIGKNTMISGITTKEDYPDGILASGRTLDKAGD